MPTPLTSINLKEWAIAPVKRFSPQAAFQSMDPDDVLTLTPGEATYFNAVAGTTVPVFGGLPTTTELNNAPYYHLIVFAGDQAGENPAEYFLTVEVAVGGFTYPLPPQSPRIPFRVYALFPPDVPAAVVYRIPAGATQIALTNVDSAGTTNVGYAYAVPQVGLTPDGEQISLISSEGWQNTALRVIPGGDIPAGASPVVVSLTLPAPAVLSQGAQGTPPYYYLCIEGQTTAPAAAGVVRVFHNGSAVPCDLFFLQGLGGVDNAYINTAPAEYVDYSTASQDNNPTHPQLRQISTAYTTSLSLEVAFDGGGNFSGRYYFVIPYNPA